MTLTEVSYQVHEFIEVSRLHLPLILQIVGAVWILNLFNWTVGSRLNVFGILPRHLWGLLGILFSPFLHGNPNHLFYNSFPFVFLGLMVLALFPAQFLDITLWIIFLSGAGVWLFGRTALHIGASSLIAGYFGFILIEAYSRPTWITLMAAIVTLYYFGGIALSIFPQEEKVSWEGHLLGILAGVATSYCLQYLNVI